ncbi:MAG: DNA glycosylase AlkZ-like family protein [Chloroflexota bacterium]
MSTTPPLSLTRAQILGHRRAAGGLDDRLPQGEESLRKAAWGGIQDSMPRAAVLSIHARVEGTRAFVLDHPSVVQLWGPRFSAYVVAARDAAVFTLGRLPDDARGLRRAEDTATRLAAFLNGRTMTYGEAGRGLGEKDPNAVRYAAPTGTVLIRWDGARQPTIWTVPRPDVDPLDARVELARRYLHVLGPGTPDSFAKWAGIKPPRAHRAFDSLREELVAVRTPIGDASILLGDEPSFRAAPPPTDAVRLLPSGDAFFLMWGADRELLVPEPERRDSLWTTRVWPGAVLAGGEIVGTWRRANELVAVQPWPNLEPRYRDAVEAEARSLPLPALDRPIDVKWDG